jgi:hypothetical protein
MKPIKEKAIEVFDMMKGLSTKFENQKSYALTYCYNVLKNPVMNDEARKYWTEIEKEIDSFLSTPTAVP